MKIFVLTEEENTGDGFKLSREICTAWSYGEAQFEALQNRRFSFRNWRTVVTLYENNEPDTLNLLKPENVKWREYYQTGEEIKRIYNK